MKRSLSCVLFAIVVSRTARADDVHGERAAAAEHLFSEGLRLLREGDFASACPKLAQAQRLDPSAGTLLNLADCYERNGQFASAWATFKEAARASVERRRGDWEAVARRHASALEPRLSWLTIDVDEPVEGLHVVCDGVAIDAPGWSTPLPMDIGRHTIEATSPERAPFRAVVEIAREGDRVTLTIPPLPPLGARSAPSEVARLPLEQEHEFGVQRTIGIVVAGIGVAGLGAATITGILASSRRDEVARQCPEYPTCDPAALGPDGARGVSATNDDAQQLATVATVAGVAGAALAVGGAVLFFTSPRRPRSATLGPIVSGRSMGLVLRGTF